MGPDFARAQHIFCHILARQMASRSHQTESYSISNVDCLFQLGNVFFRFRLIKKTFAFTDLIQTDTFDLASLHREMCSDDAHQTGQSDR